ncbi:MAG TPA: cadherin-like beta sandwich domain-containing protein [Candidatus Aphodocola excrementigallinarum]|uniref:Cadherin-like beta sandwich domain-containing protein n=1 Tax=Candidatus Aphodocola excrementigallinarum TaxID=2840670 RepID=A0A9D1ILW3_9FIRM|nr:cadherin-like beta sandwich domain-containing protein [Candidatus Aphodocola excrementigallinarum]
MKKLLCYTFITFCVMFMGMMNASAVKITISGNDRVSLNRTIDITFTVSDYNNVPGNLNIDYPSNLLQCNSNCPRTQQINGNTSFTYQFRGIANGVATINVTSNYNGADTSKQITVGTITNTTTQAPQTTQSTTTTTQAKSNNNNLSSLTLTTNEGEEVDLSPSFSPSVYTYSATVASTAKTVSVDARMEDSRANLTINGDDDELVAGENNRITITVTAEDGTPRTYTINVTREALTADATLSELSIKESKSFKLEENKYTYNVKIGKNVKTLTLDYTPSDENATVEVDGNENLKDGSKVRITVTAEDGTKRVYTLNIVKETTTTKNANTDSIEVEKNPLIIMGLSVIAFGLVGGIIYVIRK